MNGLGFAIVVATFIACDTWLFITGFNSVFHKAKTPEEKELRALRVRERKATVEKLELENKKARGEP